MSNETLFGKIDEGLLDLPRLLRDGNKGEVTARVAGVLGHILGSAVVGVELGTVAAGAAVLFGQAISGAAERRMADELNRILETKAHEAERHAAEQRTSDLVFREVRRALYAFAGGRVDHVREFVGSEDFDEMFAELRSASDTAEDQFVQVIRVLQSNHERLHGEVQVVQVGLSDLLQRFKKHEEASRRDQIENARQLEEIARALLSLSKQGQTTDGAAARSALSRLDEGDTTSAEQFFREQLLAGKLRADEHRAHAKEALRQASVAARNLAALRSVVDPAEALRLYEEAAELAPRDPEVWERIAWLHLCQGELDASEAACERVLELALRTERARALALLYLGEIKTTRGESVKGERFARSAAECGLDNGWPEIALVAIEFRANMAWMAGDMAGFEVLRQRAAAIENSSLPPRSDDTTVLRQLQQEYDFWAYGLDKPGDAPIQTDQVVDAVMGQLRGGMLPAGLQSWGGRILNWSRRLGWRKPQVLGLWLSATSELNSDESRAMLSEALEISDSMGFLQGSGLSLCLLADLARRSGAPEEANELAARALVASRKGGSPQLEYLSQILLGATTSDHSRALEFLGGASEIAERIGFRPGLGVAQELLGDVHAKNTDIQAAQDAWNLAAREYRQAGLEAFATKLDARRQEVGRGSAVRERLD